MCCLVSVLLGQCAAWSVCCLVSVLLGQCAAWSVCCLVSVLLGQCADAGQDAECLLVGHGASSGIQNRSHCCIKHVVQM